MAPIRNHHLHARHLGSNQIFPIVLGIVLFSVVVTAIGWAYIWPYFRVRYINQRFPSRTRYRDELNVTHPMRHRLRMMFLRQEQPARPMFPSHPAVLHVNPSRPLESRSPFCNGRQAESPRTSVQHDADLDLPMVPSRTRSADHVNRRAASDAFTTPTRNGPPSKERWVVEENMTMPRTRTEYHRARSIASDHRFGDAKDYILAIPEPLVLRSRSPLSGSHPPTGLNDKVFLRQGYSLPPENIFSSPTDSLPSSGVGKGSLQPIGNVESDTMSCVTSEVSTFGENEHGESAAVRNFAKRSHSLADLSESESEETGPQATTYNKSVAALNRLKTYRSLTGARQVRPLTRAGTLTRPKTPVAEIRKCYTHVTCDEETIPGPISCTDTSFTKPWTTTESSVKTSSTFRTSLDGIVSTSSLLPTPLQIPSSGRHHNELVSTDQGYITPDDLAEDEHQKSIEQVDQPNPGQIGAMIARVRSSSHLLKFASRIPVAVRKGKPACLFYPRESVQNLLVRGGHRPASSVYSRDTRGYSIFHDQRSPRFVDNAAQLHAHLSALDRKSRLQQVEPSPATPAIIDGALVSKGAINKVERWQSPLPVTNLQSLVSVSPCKDVSSENNLKFSPDIEHPSYEDCRAVSTISTELNSIDAEAIRASLPRMCIRESNVSMVPPMDDTFIEAIPTRNRTRSNSDSTIDIHGRGRAPGGARWI